LKYGLIADPANFRISPEAYIDRQERAPVQETRAQTFREKGLGGLDPNLKLYADQANAIYQKNMQLYSPFGTKASGYLSADKMQADKYQAAYDDAVTKALQNQARSGMKDVTSYQDALSVFGDVNVEDWNTYIQPELARMNITAPSGGDNQPNAYKFVPIEGGESRRGYSKIEGGVPVYYFENGEPVPRQGYRVASLTEAPKSGSSSSVTNVPTDFQNLEYLRGLKKQLDSTPKDSDQYQALKDQYDQTKQAYTNTLWEGAQSSRSDWASSIGNYGYNISLMDRMFEQLSNPSVATGFVAGTANVFENVADQAQQLVSAGKAYIGEKIPENEVSAEQLRNHTYTFGDLENPANVSGAFKANITDLAYALARLAEKGGGRLSDSDVQKQIDRIAPGGAYSKSNIATALLDIDISLRRRIIQKQKGLLAAGLPVGDWQGARPVLQKKSTTHEGKQYNYLGYELPEKDENGDKKFHVVMHWQKGE
jgi:hypothetical protein